ncbi:MAG: Ig-like domain-containing protein, partial [Calditrichota bacterium]
MTTLKKSFISLFILALISCSDEKIITSPQADHTPPSITWHQPAPDAELSGIVEVSFTALDYSGVSRIAVYRNGFNPPEWSITPQPPDTFHLIYWDTRAVSDGLYILEIRAWDEMDNVGMSPSLVVKVHNQPEPPSEDRTPPDVWWEAPRPGSTLQDSVLLRLSWFDASGV